MISLDLLYHSKGRVWVDDAPPAFFEAEHTLEHSIAATKQASFGTRRIVVELLAPKGARIDYGMLGAELRSLPTHELQVLVNISPSLNLTLPDSLMPAALDEVRLGIPYSYGMAVIEGVDLAANEIGELFAGQLHFQYAAQGLVSSSAAIFKLLSGTVVRLLMLSDTIPTEKQQLLPFFVL